MSGVLKIDSDALGAAAGAYETASSQYQNALNELLPKLKNVTDNWQDASSGDWQSKLTEVENNLAVVNERLKLNAKVLKAIADEVTATEGKVQTGIKGI